MPHKAITKPKVKTFYCFIIVRRSIYLPKELFWRSDWFEGSFVDAENMIVNVMSVTVFTYKVYIILEPDGLQTR